MKQLILFNNEGTYRLSFVNDKFEQQDYGDLTNEPILEQIILLENWVDNLKSDEQKQIVELESKRVQALSFILEKATVEEKVELIDLFNEYKVNHNYIVGDEFSWNNSIFRVLQNHTSAAHWIPDQSPSLYVDIVNKISLQDFVQPEGAHDAYNSGDKVIFEGYIWESIIDNNVWSPKDYPQGWEKGESV